MDVETRQAKYGDYWFSILCKVLNWATMPDLLECGSGFSSGQPLPELRQGLRQELSSQGIVRVRPYSTLCSSGSFVAIRALWFSVEVCVDFFLGRPDSPIRRQTQKLVELVVQ